MDQRAKARRIAENAGEEDESKKREKLQWMYGQRENDEEEYLLGWWQFRFIVPRLSQATGGARGISQ